MKDVNLKDTFDNVVTIYDADRYALLLESYSSTQTSVYCHAKKE